MKCFWRNHPVLQAVMEHRKTGTCGRLCSLRFTWQRPKKKGTDEQTFLYETFAAALDGAGYAAESKFARLEIEKVKGRNILFACCSFLNGITAEFELNEALPDTMPDTCFLKANFTHGHITNQPVVGFFNEEGMVLASDEKLEQLIAERDDIVAVGVIDQMMKRFGENGVFIDAAKLEALIRENINEEA